MQEFLYTIAKQYATRYNDLSRFCFVFPGRRSGTFFLKHLKKVIGNRKMIAPMTVTITDFTQALSDDVCDSRIDLVLLLYRCYLSLHGIDNPDDAQEEHSFENFRSWGETILADFNEIDTHLVKADELFKNLKDFNEISTDFLTEEQREVMETYFNIKQPHKEVEHFWKSFGYDSKTKDKTETDIQHRFLYHWQSLAELYRVFNEKLEEEGLSYSGKTYKQALSTIRREGTAAIEPLKIVFVGFNVLTTAEWCIFKELSKLTTVIKEQKEPLADFVWDFTGPMLNDEYNSASRFVRKGIAQFPKPEWLDLSECETESLPELKVIAAPSNSAQAKLVHEEVKELHRQLPQTEFDEAKIAVVLPDEGLMLPLIHSLPDTMIEETGSDDGSKKGQRRAVGVNLTMGLPLRHTPVLSFVTLLRRLQTRLRRDSGRVDFFIDDLETIMAHPFTHILLDSEEWETISSRLKKKRLKYVSHTFFDEYSPIVQLLFTPLSHDSKVDETIDYIDSLLAAVDETNQLKMREKKAETEVNNENSEDEKEEKPLTMDSLMHTHIETYRRALTRLKEAAYHRKVFPSMYTVFLLADKLIAGEKVSFEGEPLHGLQVMGLLETRSLDFDHIIIPSMNDGIFPRRMRSRTFIPDALRNAFGLPTARSQESIFAYYFYRLICRAKKVTMIYDARTGASHSGDPSRFILQLQHLYAKENFSAEAARFSLPTFEGHEIEIPKTSEEIKSNLNNYLEGEKQLSSSSLQKYLQCPLQFYLNYLADIKIEDKPSEYMSAIDLGNIVHEAMTRVYLDPATDNEKVKGMFRRPIPVLKPTEDRIKECIRRAINTEYLKVDPRMPLAGEPAIQSDVIFKIMKRLIDMDVEHKGLELVGVEVKINTSVTLSSGKKVHFTMIIDRLDRIPSGEGYTYRIVDYKTGKVEMVVTNVEGIFNCDSKSKYFFQLMLYALLAHNSKELGTHSQFNLVIYDVMGHKEVLPKIGKTKIEKDCSDYTDAEMIYHENLLEDFSRILNDRLTEMIDLSLPFTQTDNAKNCTYCNFKSLCGRG